MLMQVDDEPPGAGLGVLARYGACAHRSPFRLRPGAGLCLSGLVGSLRNPADRARDQEARGGLRYGRTNVARRPGAPRARGERMGGGDAAEQAGT